MKVKMQGRIQKWVDHSISVTINLPNDVDEDLVNRLYVEAWKSGCKGCTVYRDGSRSGVLISAKSDKKDRTSPVQTAYGSRNTSQNIGCRRCPLPEQQRKMGGIRRLAGRIIPTKYSPVFRMTMKASSCRRTLCQDTSSRMWTKHGNKRYDFQFENKRGYKVTIEGLSEKFNKEYWNYAKLISGVLRYRMPIEQVIKLVGSLQLDSESINTWKNGVERALKKYIHGRHGSQRQEMPELR